MRRNKRHVRIRGARVNNLKDVSVQIPRGGVTAVTGPSGSGKSSLVFGVLEAESRRRLFGGLLAVEAGSKSIPLSFPSDVDEIDGLPLIVGMEVPPSPQAFESLATASGVYPLFTQLYVHLGDARCGHCAERLSERSKQEFLHLLSRRTGVSQSVVAAPLGQLDIAAIYEARDEFLPKGFSHVMIDGQRVCWDDEYFKEALEDIESTATLSLAVDAMKHRESNFARLAEAIDLALELGDGEVEVRQRMTDSTEVVERYSERALCPSCGQENPQIRALDFLYYKESGACSVCDGLGYLSLFETSSFWEASASHGVNEAIVPWREKGLAPSRKIRESVLQECGVSTAEDSSLLTESEISLLLVGQKEESTDSLNLRRSLEPDESVSVVSLLREKYSHTRSASVRSAIERYTSTHICPACSGARVRPLAAYRELAGRRFSELFTSNVGEALEWITEFKSSDTLAELTHRASHSSAARVLLKASERLESILFELRELGIDYLGLSRAFSTLSDGEAQRVFLARELAGAMRGVMYAFDEPSSGLHSLDRIRLQGAFQRLKDKGSSVLMVEHHQDLIETSDFIVRMGPSAGLGGGEVMWSGVASEYPASFDESSQAQEQSVAPLSAETTSMLTLRGASLRNLKNLTVPIPLERLSVVCGVSGSGKSSLIVDTLIPAVSWALSQRRLGVQENALLYSRFSLDALEGTEGVGTVIDASDMRERAGYRSVVASILDIQTALRELFARSTPARVLGFQAAHFSFNSKLGQCERCGGQGLERGQLSLSRQQEITCRECSGRRYRAEILTVTWRGHSISDVFNLDIAKACLLFENIPPIAGALRKAKEFGLGYLPLGQSGRALSRGEFQRLQLAAKLGNRRGAAAAREGKALIVFDEPTRGLSPSEIDALLKLLRDLVKSGNTVVAIEHQQRVIDASDCRIELGPGAGDEGGRLLRS